MRRIQSRASHSNQRGFGVVDAMISLVILASVITVRFAMDSRDSDRLWAGRLGHEMRQINDAIASLLSTEPGFPVGTYTDFNFLRHTSCPDGTANMHYLPCAFTVADTLVGRFYIDTVVTQVMNGAGTGTVQFGTSRFGPIQKRDGVNDASIAGVAGAVAQGYSLDVNSPISASTRALYSLDIGTATIEALTTSDPSSDQWLRTGGDNEMAGDLNFTPDGVGEPVFDINGVNDVVAKRFVDHDDENYFVDPAGTSNINNLNMGGNLTINDSSTIGTASGDLNLNGADGVIINPGAGEVVIPGNSPGEGVLSVNDLVVRGFNENFNLSDMLPVYSAQGAFLAGHNDLVAKPECPTGASQIITIGSGFRVGAENADQIVNDRVFSTDYACDGSTSVGSQPLGCQSAPLQADFWTLRYTNPLNQSEYTEDVRVVMTYCFFPRS